MQNIREIIEENKNTWPINIGILQNVRGPKIRIGIYEEKRDYEYKSGDIIRIDVCPPKEIEKNLVLYIY